MPLREIDPHCKNNGLQFQLLEQFGFSNSHNNYLYLSLDNEICKYIEDAAADERVASSLGATQILHTQKVQIKPPTDSSDCSIGENTLHRRRNNMANGQTHTTVGSPATGKKS